jgi:hypothetical protein
MPIAAQPAAWHSIYICYCERPNREKDMKSYALCAVFAAVGIVGGCGGKTESVSGVGQEARQAISQAAVARYPGRAMTSPDVQLTAINYPTKDYLEIHNTGTSSIPRWVNGTFLTTIDGIAPKGFVTVQHGSLLEAGPATNDLKKLNQPVSKVEVETDRGLFTVQGPTIKR